MRQPCGRAAALARSRARAAQLLRCSRVACYRWDPDELMLSMQQTMNALDASGSKRAELQKQREARRQATLDEAVSGTSVTPAALADLIATVLQQASSAKPLALAVAAAGPASTDADPSAAVAAATEPAAAVNASEPAAAPAAGPAGAPPAISLCSTCLERYLRPPDLAALLLASGPHLAILGLAQTPPSESADAPQTVAASAAERMQCVERLFELLLDGDATGLLSSRALLIGLGAGGPPSEAVQTELHALGLESHRPE